MTLEPEDPLPKSEPPTGSIKCPVLFDANFLDKISRRRAKTESGQDSADIDDLLRKRKEASHAENKGNSDDIRRHLKPFNQRKKVGDTPTPVMQCIASKVDFRNILKPVNNVITKGDNGNTGNVTQELQDKLLHQKSLIERREKYTTEEIRKPRPTIRPKPSVDNSPNIQPQVALPSPNERVAPSTVEGEDKSNDKSANQFSKSEPHSLGQSTQPRSLTSAGIIGTQIPSPPPMPLHIANLNLTMRSLTPRYDNLAKIKVKHVAKLCACCGNRTHEERTNTSNFLNRENAVTEITPGVELLRVTQERKLSQTTNDVEMLNPSQPGDKSKDTAAHCSNFIPELAGQPTQSRSHCPTVNGIVGTQIPSPPPMPPSFPPLNPTSTSMLR